MDSIDISKWQVFVIGELFKISRPITRSSQQYTPGDTPFVASGNFNNGITEYCTPHEGELLDKGNCITVSPLDGAAFYQERNFLGRGGAGSAILILRNVNLNKLRGLYLSAVIRKTLNRFSYNDQVSSEVIKKIEIKLPVNNQSEPDWKFMDEYMQYILKDVAKRNNLLLKIM